jgi:prephenate dehydrogenase
MGLALREAGVASAVIGHDKDPEVGGRAKKMGAVDKVKWNLISACENADMVILATPVGAMEETLETIGPHLRSDCIVLDTGGIKVPVLQWAEALLPEQIHFVGCNPIVRAPVGLGKGVEGARPDLFRGGVFCLMPLPRTKEKAVDQVVKLTSILGAQPLFCDPVEHDALLAAVDQLPSFLALALLETVIHEPAWRELRKMAGSSFGGATRLAVTDPSAAAEAFLSNRENILRWLDTFSVTLARLRSMLAEEQTEELAQRFREAQTEREKWLQLSQEGKWAEGNRAELPERPGVMDTLFGTFWRKVPKRDSSS